jgi:transcriptional regulator with XRE-family HTH domain
MAEKRRLLSTAGVSTSKRKELFGEVVRRRRAAAKMTQEQLSHRSGLTTAFISLVENGHKAPSIISLQQLASALGVKAAILIAEWERKCKQMT